MEGKGISGWSGQRCEGDSRDGWMWGYGGEGGKREACLILCTLVRTQHLPTQWNSEVRQMKQSTYTKKKKSKKTVNSFWYNIWLSRSGIVVV